MQPLDFGLMIFEFVVMLLALSLHDCAQAWAANRLGDPTARMTGRLTMNPMQHFDLFGTAIFPIIYLLRSPPIVLAWSKPVPMTSRNFRNMKRDEILAIAAGPAAQLLAATLALVILVILRHVDPSTEPALLTASQLARHIPGVSTVDLPSVFPVILFLYFCIFVNLLLLVFNLIPFPFFDGGRILLNYLPYNAAQAFQRYSLYFMIGFFFFGFGIVMLFFGPLMAIFNSLLFHL